MNMKICNKCKIEKPLTDFAINKKAKDGLNYKCRTCQNTYNAMIQAHYRERARLRGKIFRQKRSEENEMVKYISFKTFNFPRDYSNTQKLLQLIGYDITQDIHLQFNQRVLMKHGKVLEYKVKPKDVLTKYFE